LWIWITIHNEVATLAIGDEIAQSTSADFRAIDTVLKAQNGRMRDLYGSKVKTPISPRAMACEKQRPRLSIAGMASGGSGIPKPSFGAMLLVQCTVKAIDRYERESDMAQASFPEVTSLRSPAIEELLVPGQ
jgi:hypothetical protein